jgi:hypothetical protein
MNKDLIVNWNDIRVKKGEVTDLFKEAGNFFSFTLNEAIADDLHIYFGINGSERSFYIIKASEDTVENESFLAHASMDNAKKTLPVFNTGSTENENTISWDDANDCINNWISDSKRETWIDDRFAAEGDNGAIFLAFRVDAVDIAVGEEHEFYLSLKEDNNTLNADLIVVNVESGIVSKNIEDMVHSVPPFGDIYSKFGLLKSLNIK